MNRINILDESVFNKIAAGEVVEKPASIVKEFVENSLDANATEILIEIENGGIDKIRVVDNGCGIHPDDVKSAFIIHATSKIKNVDDLYNIATLGFRGEALSSIASVTKLKMQTKQSNFFEGKQIVIDGGIVKDFGDVAMNNGTIIETADLFYNIPARKKFLRKPKTEESEITNLIIRYILANPQIKFSYVVDGNLIYKSSGTNLEDALYVVYKKEAISNFIKVDYSIENIHIYGYISKPSNSKSNRTYQTLIINHRYVVNNLISTCVQNAYENLLMKGQFPMFVLNFDLPTESVDVNVHPNKLDVKFENTQKIYGYFYTAISKALMTETDIKQVSIFDDNNLKKPIKELNTHNDFVGKSFSENNFENNNQSIQNSFEAEKQNKQLLETENEVYKKFEKLTDQKDMFCESEIMSKVIKRQVEREQEKVLSSHMLEEANQNIVEVNLLNENFGENSQNNNKNSKNFATKQQIFDNIKSLNYKVVGVLFNTYILIEIDSSMFVFDQHACHERLNYDRLINEIQNKNLSIQPLLVPYIFETNTLETEFLEEKIDLISSLGFEISLFGQNCFKVSTVPSIIGDINLKSFFEDILKDLLSLKKLSTENLLKEKLSQKACKASIKAGDKLDNKQIEMLLNLMQKNNMTLSCPHGRPAVVEITKTELEKWFKRIV